MGWAAFSVIFSKTPPVTLLPKAVSTISFLFCRARTRPAHAESRHAPVLKNLISILITCRSDEEWFLGADTELNKKLFNVFFSNDS
jgi:hypothetical protein